MARDPLRFVRPCRRNCRCPSCQVARATVHPWMTPAERRAATAPPPPRTPEDGQTVRTPEQGDRPIQTRD